jgi:DNA-binding NarL/FixJ family response regulator
LRQRLAEGKTTCDIAIASGCSVKTAQPHRGNFMQKLHLHSTSEGRAIRHSQPDQSPLTANAA